MMAINLRDYTRTAAQRGWGAGWPSCSGAKAAGTAIVTADLSGTRFSVHKRIARLVDLLADATERRGYRLVPGQCGGYNCRAIGGTRSPSNHSWGLAVDLNWHRNPMRRPLTTDMPTWMVAMWNRYGFAWGGHYTSTPDAMHFEFMGTPGQADQMTALALRELAPGAPTPPVTTQPVTPATKKVKPVIDREKLVKGPNYVRLPAMVGSASGLYGRAWVSVSAHGGSADTTILFQRDTDTDGAPAGTRGQWKPVVKNGSREWLEIPSGTEYLECWVNVRGDGGFVAVEFQPK